VGWNGVSTFAPQKPPAGNPALTDFADVSRLWVSNGVWISPREHLEDDIGKRAGRGNARMLDSR